MKESGDGGGPNRPVRSTRGQNKKYDDGVSGSDDDDDAPLSSLKKKRKRSGSDAGMGSTVKSFLIVRGIHSRQQQT